MSSFRSAYGPIILKITRNNGDGTTNVDGKAILNIPSNINITEPWEIAVSKLFMVNSISNINSVYANNVFQYSVSTTSGTVTRTVTIPKGCYDIPDLSNYLQSVMLANGDVTYSSTATGSIPQYFITISANLQTNQLIVTLPTVFVPASGTNPNNLTTGVTMSLIVPSFTSSAFSASNTSFSGLIGFASGSYPTSFANSQQVFTSTTVPDFYHVFVINIACNWVIPSSYDNYLGNIYTFSEGDTPYQAVLNINPPVLVWTPVTMNSYNNMIIQLLDQNNQPLQMVDNQLFVEVLLRKVGFNDN